MGWLFASRRHTPNTTKIPQQAMALVFVILWREPRISRCEAMSDLSALCPSLIKPFWSIASAPWSVFRSPCNTLLQMWQQKEGEVKLLTLLSNTKAAGLKKIQKGFWGAIRMMGSRGKCFLMCVEPTGGLLDCFKVKVLLLARHADFITLLKPRGSGITQWRSHIYSLQSPVERTLGWDPGERNSGSGRDVYGHQLTINLEEFQRKAFHWKVKSKCGFASFCCVISMGILPGSDYLWREVFTGWPHGQHLKCQ